LHNYSIAGLNVASEFALPAAMPVRLELAAQPEVTIRWGKPPHAIRDVKFRGAGIEAGERDVIFRPREGLAYLISNGREITISRTLEISDSEVYLFLVGSVWGILCHQRGLLPLHCGAIAFENRAIAFTGPSGAGKSTLVAGLSKRGYAHLCDDVCIAEPAGNGVRFLAMPKGLKLWGDATEALCMERGAAITADKRWDKFYVSVPEHQGTENLVVSALYVLTGDDTQEPNISPLRGSERFQAIFSNIYRCEWLNLMREKAEVFDQVVHLAQELHVYRFARPRVMSRFDQGLDVLEAHMRRMVNE